MTFSIHSFPLKDEERCALWVEAVCKPNWKPSKSSVVCSLHFKESDYLIKPGTYIKHLNQYAVPAAPKLTIVQRDKLQNNSSSASKVAYTNSSNKVQKNITSLHVAAESLAIKDENMVLSVRNQPKKKEIRLLPKRIEQSTACGNHSYARKPEEASNSKIVYMCYPVLYPMMNTEVSKPSPKQEHDQDALEKAQLRRKIKTLTQTVCRQRKRINSLKILLRKLYRHKLSKEGAKSLLVDKVV